jgi:flagellar P-ring protein precursor FlgI
MYKKMMSVLLAAVFLAGQFLFLPPATTEAAVVTRVKDISKVQGVRSNQLVGYGIVVGLAGTGDSDKSSFTVQSVINMLKTFGVSVNPGAQTKLRNVAAVMVTAELPPFVKPGDTIDINLSSIGDAKSIEGGTLLQTPLQAANGEVYAVCQGSISTGGFSAGGGGASQRRNFPTVGRIPNGAIVEREVIMHFHQNGRVALSLNQPDFTTATRISETINRNFGGISNADNPGTVSVFIPSNQMGAIVNFIAAIEDLPIVPDNRAKVVVNERTGTVVVGGMVTIDTVAVSQGGLSIKIGTDTVISQPGPFSGGSTAVVRNPNLQVEEKQAHLLTLPAASNVSDVVRSLNAVGATPNDIISILQAIKAAGALNADLEII